MPNKLSDFLVVSDMDGTLLRTDKSISRADLDTIRLFRMLGGHFTVATGRTIASVAMYPELAANIEPAITSGGCVIYDFTQKRAVKSLCVPPGVARAALSDILGRFPGVGAMVMGEDTRLYAVSHSAELRGLMDFERMTWFTRPYEDLPPEWNKVLFAGPRDMLSDIANFVSTRHYPGVYFVSTNVNYFEMMPEGASKGKALRELAVLLGVNMNDTCVIGDYYNDLDMMREAGRAVAMDNAPEDVRAAAGEVTGTNDEGGVAQFLYKLIRQYGPA